MNKLTEKEVVDIFNKCYPNNSDGDVVTLIDFANAIMEAMIVKNTEMTHTHKYQYSYGDNNGFKNNNN